MEGVSAHFLVSQESCISASIQKKRKKKRGGIPASVWELLHNTVNRYNTNSVLVNGYGRRRRRKPVACASHLWERGQKLCNQFRFCNWPTKVVLSRFFPPLVDTNIVQKKRKNKNKYCVHPSQGDVFRQNSPPPHSHLTSLHGIRTNLFDLLPFHETH